jgi:large subunit ribosomal protein L10
MAELPPLDVLRAQLIGMISGPARNLAGVVAGGVRQVVNVLNAYADQEKQEAGAEA